MPQDDQFNLLARQVARDSNLPEKIVKKALGDLIKAGHLRIVPGPGSTPVLEFIIKGRAND